MNGTDPTPTFLFGIAVGLAICIALYAIFKRKEQPPVEDTAANAYEREIERRKWAVEQVVYCEELHHDQIVHAAAYVYEWVWGKQDA